MNLNKTQIEILTQLNRTSESRRYSELQISNIENDLFNYHLQFLVGKNLIDKNNSHYTITQKGKKFMANLDAKGNTYDLFRFSVAVNVIKQENNKTYILAQRRKRHPYFNDVSTIAGKVKKGELVTEAAIRKFKEETGLTIKDVKNLGILRKIRKDQKDHIIEDTVYTIFYSENFAGKLIKENEFGENMWLTWDEFLKLHSKNIDVGEFDKEIFQRIKNRNFDSFYFEQVCIIDSY